MRKSKFNWQLSGLWASSKKFRPARAVYGSKINPDSPEAEELNLGAQGLSPLGLAANFLSTAGSQGLGNYSLTGGNSTLAAQSSDEPYVYIDHPVNYGYIDADLPNLSSDIRGWTRHDNYYSGIPYYVYVGNTGRDIARGGSGQDVMFGGSGDDEFYGGGGGDRIYGDKGDDFIDGGDGHDSLDGGEGNDTIYGGNGNDSLFGGDGDDFLDGGAGNDTMYGDAGDDLMYGGAGDDYLSGSSGNDRLYGGDGDDRLDGGDGNDLLDGGAGNDELNGGIGDDLYVFGRGYGHDTIREYDANPTNRDVLRLVGLSRDEVDFMVSGGSFIVRIKDTGETITVKGGVPANNATSFNPYGIEAIEFGDGRVMGWADIAQGQVIMEGTNMTATYFNTIMKGGAGNDHLYGGSGHDILYGGDGDDTLNGGAGHDILDGGAGNDTLTGGAGNDVFVFGRGYGHDTVSGKDSNQSKRDMLRLVGLTRDEVDLMTSGSDFVVRIKDTGETITISLGATTNKATDFNAYGIEAIEFGDGRVMEWAEIAAGEVIIEGTDGNDNLTARYINSIMYGGAGNDRLTGGDGHDILDGGAGNDTLYGGAGNDVYVFGRGYGHDSISESDATQTKRDVLRLAGLSRGEVDFMVSAHDFIVRIKDTGETMTVKLGAYTSNAAAFNPYGLEAIEFGDGRVMEWAEIATEQVIMEGTDGNDNLRAGYFDSLMSGGAGNDYLYGGSGNDILHGGTGNDTLSGGAGDDTYVFNPGDGQDSINNSGGGDDLLFFRDINPAELWFGQSGRHLTIGLVGSQDQVTVSNWFYGDDYKIDTIQAGNEVITETQVAQLVQAMAALGAPAGVDGQWSTEQQEALAPVLATYWQPKL